MWDEEYPVQRDWDEVFVDPYSGYGGYYDNDFTDDELDEYQDELDEL